jgi:hypothetical protein
MSRRNLIIIAAALGVIILLSIIWFFFIRTSDTVPFEEGQVPARGTLPQSANVPQTQVEGPSINDVPSTDPRFAEQLLLEDLRTRSQIFVERLTSYSSDSTLSNMTDLYFQMTPPMQLSIQNKRAGLLASFKNINEFIGYSVSVLASDVSTADFLNGKVSIAVSAQKETREGSITRSEVAQYEVIWQKQENSTWLVNEFNGEI